MSYFSNLWAAITGEAGKLETDVVGFFDNFKNEVVTKIDQGELLASDVVNDVKTEAEKAVAYLESLFGKQPVVTPNVVSNANTVSSTTTTSN